MNTKSQKCSVGRSLTTPGLGGIQGAGLQDKRSLQP